MAGMKPIKVVAACEFSGRVAKAFADRGCYGCSVDPRAVEEEPDEYSFGMGPTYSGAFNRYRMDIFEHIRKGSGFSSVDVMIAFPPCTYLCSSGLHWNKRNPAREKLTEDAILFVRKLMDQPDIPYIAIENPVGCISTRIDAREYGFRTKGPTQIIQPYCFGEDASKKTCLWLKGLPDLKPTQYVEPRWVNGKPRWGNQTDSGQNRLPPRDDRSDLRSLTYQGIADAMADQWCNFLENEDI